MNKEIKLDFSLALCMESGDGYEEGCIYPILGNNNEIHIVRDDNGGPYDKVFVSGGIGIGDISSAYDCVNPSFVAIPLKPLGRFRQWKIRHYVRKWLKELG